ncbi:hypothetical protein AKJ36_00210 [candidate division MSBL1 archaeon SCGC-AAA259I07]|uniref:MarR family transcriptional regulator n=1 Tax=candidate division MSBL1 archaeon SCGC-AAA259I07 TaxID=1698266 RepID=A0A133UNB2_9EURY|nr:hypothetical protein AKJ36_00210 [candidate division MSBL1 archaeon SCGC-AAA259I07]
MVSLIDVRINSNGLSSRENRILKIFERLDSKVISTETLRQLSGYGHKVLHKTIGKLVRKGYLKKATTCEVQFYKTEREKLEEALDEMKEEGLIADSSEIIP